MAWTAPMTAVANTAFTAAQFNTHVRDNLLETAPAKATAGVGNGSYFVKTGTNAIAARLPSRNNITTEQSTSSTSYTNLATTGPAVTITTGTRALVILSANVSNNSTNSAYMGITVSGASTSSASDQWAMRFRPHDAGGNFAGSYVHLYETLTAGSNTFTAKYRVNGGTGSWSERFLFVLPF